MVDTVAGEHNPRRYRFSVTAQDGQPITRGNVETALRQQGDEAALRAEFQLNMGNFELYGITVTEIEGKPYLEAAVAPKAN